MKREGFLVLGAGSIGRRHARNLLHLGASEVAFCDLDPERLRTAAAEVAADAPTFTDYGQALAEFVPEAVLVCTPPALHVPHARAALEASAHVFIEKPVSHSREGLEQLQHLARERGRVIQVGYNLRFHPGLREVKALLEDGSLGRVLWVRAEFGQYLPDWRTWQDYRQSYTARRELGGGILLDASHEIDYVCWLLGRPEALVCHATKVSDLEVDVEDTATVILRFADGSHADIHVDFLQRRYARTCKLACEHGTVEWDYPAQQVRVFRAGSPDWTVTEHRTDPNEMYLGEMRHFLNSLGGSAEAGIGLSDGDAVLRMIVAAKESVEAQRWVELQW